MKQTTLLLCFFCLATIHAQNISDYEYIYVPKKFKDFEQNRYNLNTLLIDALQKKNYKVIQEEIQKWPDDLKLNSCKVATAELHDTSNMLRTKVSLQFTDCGNKILLESKATSMEKDFDLGFQEALHISLTKVPASMPNPSNISSGVKEKAKESTPMPIDQKEIQEIKKEDTPVSSEIKKAETYSNGKLNLQKIQISDSQFILVSSSSVPFATFKNTTKKDVYRVQLENGIQTLGYLENGNIVIELPSGDGSYQKAVFSFH